MASKKMAEIGANCVACGYCVPACPLGALQIYKGVRAQLQKEKCVGCGKCEAVCPAGIIDIIERPGATT